MSGSLAVVWTVSIIIRIPHCIAFDYLEDAEEFDREFTSRARGYRGYTHQAIEGNNRGSSVAVNRNRRVSSASVHAAE